MILARAGRGRSLRSVAGSESMSLSWGVEECDLLRGQGLTK